MLIAEGRVSVNGATVTRQGVCIVPSVDSVLVDGRPVARQRERYWAVYKPRGVVSTCHDPEGRRTVLDVMPPTGERLYPVGRLDFDSEGLLLLTNDGALAGRLMHPRHEVEKVYRVQTPSTLTAADMQRARQGVESDGETLRVAAIVPERSGGHGPVYRVVLREGRKRQIRRIFDALGHRVSRLTRIAIGPLALGRLQVGQWRELDEREVAVLYKAARLAPAGASGDKS